MSQFPTPGQEKIVSVKMAPDKSRPTCSPMTVITGISALRSAWMRITCQRGNPFARAVRT